MRVFIVQHEPSVPPGLIADVLNGSGADIDYVHAWRADALWPQTSDMDALVVLGGTMNVDQIADFPFLADSRALMARSIERGIPTLGVCLGSQMMARVLGSDVTRAEPRNAFFSELELSYDGRSDPLIARFDRIPVLQFHEDTFVMPHDAVPLATSTSSRLPQAFRYGDSAYAIQFHFEVDRQILERWLHDLGRRSLVEEWDCSEQELLRTADAYLPAQSAAGRELVARFVEIAARSASGGVPST